MKCKAFVVLLFVLPGFRFALAQCNPPSLSSVGYSHVTCYGGSNGSVQPQFTGGTGPYTFYWTPIGYTSRTISGVPAGTYTITVTDANGCQMTRSFTVNENLAAGPTASDVTVCKGAKATLTASGAPADGSYKWYTSATGTTPIPGETASTFTTPKIKATTTWYVSQVTAAGCESARTAVTARMINPLYPLVDLDSSMIMHYTFNNNLTDSTGRHGNAAVFQRTSFVSDRNAKPTAAIRLQVVDDMMDDYGYVNFPASNDLQTLTDKLTISFWMTRNTAIGVIAPLLNKWQGGTGFFIGTRTTDAATFERRIYWKIGPTEMTSNTAIPFVDNIWHHVVCVYDGAALQVYQNGVFAGSVPHSGNIPITSVNMRMGRLADGSDGTRFTGRVDELRIYNRVLSANEIETLHNNESVAFNGSPVCEGGPPIDLRTFAVPGATYQWTGPNSFSSASRTASAVYPGTYTLKVSKNGCSTAAQPTTVVVNALPATTITPSGAPAFCEGNNVTLTAPNAASWLWSTGATTRSITVSESNGYTVKVTDTNGCSATSGSFAVTVTPINDAPSFSKGTDVVADEGATARVISGWATAISAGPGESAQALSFNVGNDNHAIFSVQPSLTASGDLSFTPAADVSGTAQVTLSLKDNGGTACGVDESATQTFTITVNPVNDAPSFTRGSDVVIAEDAPAQTVNAWASAISAGLNEATQTVAFQVTNDNTALFSVQPSVSASGVLTFTPASNTFGTAQVTLSLKDDGGTTNGGDDQSDPQTFTITINPVNDPPSFNLPGSIITAEDSPLTPFTVATSIVKGPANESAQALSFTVGNNNNALFTDQPSISATGVLGYTLAPNKHGTATVTVSLKDDGGTADGGVDQSADKTLTILVSPVNDAPSFTKGADIVLNEDEGAQSYASWASDISAGPADESTQAVSFTVTNDNNALFTIQPAVSAAGALTFTPANDVSGVANITLYLSDNGGTTLGGRNRSGDQTFTMTINAVNDVPSFTKGGDVTVDEDAGTWTLSGWASGISPGDGESSQALAFQVSNDNPALFSTQPAINASGELSFTAAANASGTAQVTASVKDDGGTANGGDEQSGDEIFTITINAVNDAPSFVKGNDVSVYENAPAQTFGAWASAISAGPGEPSQTLSFQVDNDNNALFSAQPEITASGDLSFTPAPNVSGIVSVTVFLQDNGGTANGGADRSVQQTFMITINPINHAPSFTKGNDISVNEDAAAYSAPWATNISAGDAGQVVSFVVTANPDLFSAHPAIDASGNLSFQVKPDASGSAVVTVYAKDNGGTISGGTDQSGSQTFTIAILPVNDPPRVDPVDDRTIPVNSQPVVIALSGIDPGVGEDAQTLHMEVSADNTSALASMELAPLENGTASLTLSPSEDFTGTVTITIRLKDNGGTASGGEDETTVSFVLTIEPEMQTVFLPNFFSPDNTGVNDVFRVRGAGIDQIQFRIYSVDGHELFSTTDVTMATETGWDGRYKGQDMPAGTYTWTLQGRYMNGQPITSEKNRYGQVILMR